MESKRKTGLDPIVTNSSALLILGTMPGEKSLSSNEYYANPSNRFRRLLFDTFNEPFETSYEAFVGVLHNKNIALWNVLASCERTGSADRNITQPSPNDIPGFLVQYPSIRKICFESKRAAQYYDTFFGRMPSIVYDVLPSASALYARMDYDQKLHLWKSVLLT